MFLIHSLHECLSENAIRSGRLYYLATFTHVYIWARNNKFVEAGAFQAGPEAKVDGGSWIEISANGGEWEDEGFLLEEIDDLGDEAAEPGGDVRGEVSQICDNEEEWFSVTEGAEPFSNDRALLKAK